MVDAPFASLVPVSGKQQTRKPRTGLLKATDAHPRSSGNGDQSLLAPTRAIPSPALGPATNPLPIPLLAALPLYRDAGRIADLDPDSARPGFVADRGDPCGESTGTLATGHHLGTTISFFTGCLNSFAAISMASRSSTASISPTHSLRGELVDVPLCSLWRLL